MPKDTEPTVKLTPDFAVGETVIHKGERTEHKILAINAAGFLTLSGVAVLIRPEAVLKK